MMVKVFFSWLMMVLPDSYQILNDVEKAIKMSDNRELMARFMVIHGDKQMANVT